MCSLREPGIVSAQGVPMNGAEATSIRPWSVVATLAWRELVRFFRQRNRVVGALGQPLLFWLLFGAGMQRSFRMGDADSGPSFLEYYFPGTMMLVLLFTAIFATISIIEDRREGFLQSVLVAPIPDLAIVGGKVLGGASIAWLQGVLFLALAAAFQGRWQLLELVQAGAFLALASLGLTALGFVMAWRMESTQGFHAVMNLVLMPLWLLSGAFFPVPAPSESAGMSEQVMHWLMRLNPLTYGVAGLRRLLGTAELPDGFYYPSLSACWMVTMAFASVTMLLASRIVRGRTAGDLL